MTAQMVMAMMSSRLCLRVRSWRGSSREAKCVASERSFRADMANLRARMSKNTEVGWPGWDQPSSHCPQTTYFDAIALRNRARRLEGRVLPPQVPIRTKHDDRVGVQGLERGDVAVDLFPSGRN